MQSNRRDGEATQVCNVEDHLYSKLEACRVSKNLDGNLGNVLDSSSLQVVEDHTRAATLKQDMATSTARVNTDTPGMAKTFWRTNQLAAGKAMRESKFDAWLDAAASNPDMVREMAGLRKRGER